MGKVFDKLATAIEELYRYTLGPFPKGKDYSEDPRNLPFTLHSGYFAQPKKVDVIDPQVKGVVSAAGINALWLQDKVFIIKLTDNAYGQGKGEACKAYAKMTVCIDGVAHIVARWAWLDPLEGTGTINNWLSDSHWFAWGAYGEGSADGTDNANHLPEYGLNLEDIVKSSVKTQDKFGYLYKQGLSETADVLKSQTSELEESELYFWNIPVCDIESIIGKNKHLGDPFGYPTENRIPMWSGCTCLLDKKWPKDVYKEGGDGIFTAYLDQCPDHWEDND